MNHRHLFHSKNICPLLFLTSSACGMNIVMKTKTFIIFIFIYSNCILHPHGSSNYNTKACKHIKEKQHKHNKYVNVGEIFDRRGPYTQGLTINV
jgi:hypothetical protein